MAKLFLKELKLQLDLVQEHIAEIKDRGKTDAFGTTIRKKDIEEYRKLCARRRDLRRQIINFEP
jgi:hypothetical protein